jgi:thiamine biosynthesis lipoprotein
MKYRPAAFILSLYSLFFISAPAQPPYAQEDVFHTANQLQRPILLVFSGSDWCLPCQWLEKRIFSDSSFRDFAEKNLVILKADFPQKKKLSAEQTIINEKLAEEFNPEGIFPRLLLLSPAKSILSLLEFTNYTPEKFINQIKTLLDTGIPLSEYKAKAKLMGSAFEFIVTAAHPSEADEWLADCIAEVQRIEKRLTEFSEDSETALINKNAGKEPVEVSAETWNLLQRSIRISQLTGGAFDISSGVLKKLYRFKNEQFDFPASETINTALQKTGYKKIILLPGNRVQLEVPGMHIGFGAIGKGYAADKVRKLMETRGVKGGVINASGDLTAWGNRSNGEAWKSGIAHPDHKEQIMLWLPLHGASIATSGNYEQYFEWNGKRFSHNIDPKTGMPVKAVKSVSVISPSAELSDALATAVSIMGPDAGLHMINQLPQTHCIIIDEKNKLHASSSIHVSITA